MFDRVLTTPLHIFQNIIKSPEKLRICATHESIQLTFTCSKLVTETREKEVKYVQS